MRSLTKLKSAKADLIFRPVSWQVIAYPSREEIIDVECVVITGRPVPALETLESRCQRGLATVAIRTYTRIMEETR